jgi:pimeloyl-ACP methyl ester carboxylesterase
MAEDKTPQGLVEIQRALANRDLAALRRAVMNLSDEEQELFGIEIGAAAAARATRSARRSRRGGKRGRVVVVHGIMGSMLEVTDPKGDVDLVWVNAFRLINGRIGDLELDDAEQSAKPGYQVRTAGLMRKAYVPLLLALDEQWDVLPFAFDWRLDIDTSAEQLAREIRAWAHGEPVHIVAHSMGGLVSRAMIRLDRELWRNMRDPANPERGGRLVMLGTPNLGSYSIPLALSGQEKLVKLLELCDVHHNTKELLHILDSFTGSYQMLPSPFHDLPDQHADLYDKKNWGTAPVRDALLQKARRFHESLRGVIDAPRFVYVAGYDRPTPFLVTIKSDGRLDVGSTRDGDGRVPHALGLLPDVKTLWVDEDHGALASNDDVLDAIHDLLATGDTDRLEQTRPQRRTARAPGREDTEEIPAEAIALAEKSKPRARGTEPNLTQEEALRLEGYLVDGYAGKSRERAAGEEEVEAPREKAAQAPRGEKKRERKEHTGPPLRIEVVWGDITKVEKGDVFTVGHYQGVLPQRAELALDWAVSGGREPLVITEHARHGRLRGTLGEITYFPWGDKSHRERVVAVAGMGPAGAFGPFALRRLIRELALSVALLPNAETVCTVLIGSGEGTLDVAAAVRGMLEGLADAFGEGSQANGVKTLCIVERDRDRVEQIQRALETYGKEDDLPQRFHFEIANKPKRSAGSAVSHEDALREVLATLHRGSGESGNAASRKTADSVLAAIADADVRRTATEALRTKTLDARVTLAGGRDDDQDAQAHPPRISAWEDRGTIHMAAITRTTTVSERTLNLDRALIEEIVAGINDPNEEPRSDLATFLNRCFVPRDLRTLLTTRGDQIVFEVDRFTARIHWEMFARDVTDPGAAPIGVQMQVARQLRTTYSAPPGEPRRREGNLEVLVVGDPGDPKLGDDLPGAREEAIRVCDVLRRIPGVDVTPLIGAPLASRRGLPRDNVPATRVEVLSRLMHGGYDVLHYCGHGDFDPDDPTRVGWVFAGGLLTANEIERLDDAPALIVANACLSSRTSYTTESKKPVDKARSERGLLPSLADEFFRLGVRHYVGTSWEVNDYGAIEFADKFYASLVEQRSTVGKAVLAGRTALWDKRKNLGKLWAAYQHYGDPNDAIFSSIRPIPGGPPPSPPKDADRTRPRKGREPRAKG